MLLRFDIIKDREADLEHLLEMKSESNDVYWSGYTSAPEREKFAVWYKEQLERSDRKIWLARPVEDSTASVGYLYLTFENDCAYLSHGVKQDFGGKGIGSQIINFATNICLSFFPGHEIESWVVEPNTASINTFLKNNFRKTELVKEVYYASFQQNLPLFNYRFSKT